MDIKDLKTKLKELDPDNHWAVISSCHEDNWEYCFFRDNLSESKNDIKICSNKNPMRTELHCDNIEHFPADLIKAIIEFAKSDDEDKWYEYEPVTLTKQEARAISRSSAEDKEKDSKRKELVQQIIDRASNAFTQWRD